MSHDYREAFRQGHAINVLVAETLTNMGIPAYAPELVIAETQQEIDDMKYADKDVIFIRSGKCIEVKSRNEEFYGNPSSFPFSTVIVDTASGWDAKPDKPLAVVYFSLVTASMFVIPTSTEEHWFKSSIKDPQRGIRDNFYMVDRKRCRSFIDFVEHLHKYNA